MAIDLIDVISRESIDGSNGEHFCSNQYWLWENRVAKPMLEALGYSNITFTDGERDSFGPLSRVVSAIKDGVCSEFYYG